MIRWKQVKYIIYNTQSHNICQLHYLYYINYTYIYIYIYICIYIWEWNYNKYIFIYNIYFYSQRFQQWNWYFAATYISWYHIKIISLTTWEKKNGYTHIYIYIYTYIISYNFFFLPSYNKYSSFLLFLSYFPFFSLNIRLSMEIVTESIQKQIYHRSHHKYNKWNL